ncbi:splicing regulator SDE2-like [Apostichopus japonicus]|uniref:splicing regulator SDE2-like n=1 Tax=Stichopus japonicus TaxID=307972 RepID=UPI003AB5BA10
MTIYVQKLLGDLVEVPVISCGPRGKHLKEWISSTQHLPLAEVVLYHNGLLVQEEDQLKANGVYHISLRLRGGKGGFGSMLRMIGAQIEKTTNHEACRDLSGRRMRDVNNEKKLADWIAKKADREREKEERRQAKLEKLRSEPKHYFVDPKYDKQKSKVAESLDEAITQGIYASAYVDEPSSSTEKRKLEGDSSALSSKKSRLWLGVEVDSDSDDSDEEKETSHYSKVKDDDSDSDDSDEETEATFDSKVKEDKCPSESKSVQSPLIKDKPLIPSEGATPGHKGDHEPPTNVSGMEENPTQEEGAAQNAEDKSNKTTKENPNASKQVMTALNLEEVETVAELEALGLDQLKKELISRGLKCGGTLQQRAERLFQVKGLLPEQIDPSLKAKPPKVLNKNL